MTKMHEINRLFEVVNSGVLQDGIKSVLDDIDLASVAGKVGLRIRKDFLGSVI